MRTDPYFCSPGSRFAGPPSKHAGKREKPPRTGQDDKHSSHSFSFSPVGQNKQDAPWNEAKRKQNRSFGTDTAIPKASGKEKPQRTQQGPMAGQCPSLVVLPSWRSWGQPGPWGGDPQLAMVTIALQCRGPASSVNTLVAPPSALTSILACSGQAFIFLATRQPQYDWHPALPCPFSTCSSSPPSQEQPRSPRQEDSVVTSEKCHLAAFPERIQITCRTLTLSF